MGYIYDIIKIISHPMSFEDYLKLDKKPQIRIENNIFNYMGEDFFINADFRKAEDPSSYVYFKDEFIQVVDCWHFVGMTLYFEAPKECIIKEPKTYIYLMFDKLNGRYKIGISKNPQYRETTLQSEKPDIVLHSYFDGTLSDEKELHKIFAPKRIRGEWFNLDKSDINKIVKYFSE